MKNAIYEEKVKNYSIKIYQDENALSPKEFNENENDDSVFLTAFHREFWVESNFFSKEDCQSIAETMKHTDYHVFGLEAYIHSGVTLSIRNEGNFPDRRWDVSYLGLVFVSKKETKSRKKAYSIAKSLIAEWNDYLSGNVYGFVIEKEGDHIDSCWGFYGDYETYCLIEARNELNAIIKQENKEHCDRLKNYIKSKVNLQYRFN
jgi:hypothetical protein